MKYLLDTSAINRILDERLDISELPPNSEYAITHLQIDEINNTKNSDRRARLSLMQSQIRPELIQTNTLVVDISRVDHAKLGNGKIYKEILNELECAKSSKENNIRDALIAETAIVNGYCLLTADNALADAAEKNGCMVQRIDS